LLTQLIDALTEQGVITSKAPLPTIVTSPERRWKRRTQSGRLPKAGRRMSSTALRTSSRNRSSRGMSVAYRYAIGSSIRSVLMR
jgi:hypothetical protein